MSSEQLRRVRGSKIAGAVLLLVCVGMLAAQTPQQPAKPAETQPPAAPQAGDPTLKRAPQFASISGTVVSAATGEPLPSAEVQAMEKDGKDFQVAKADASGAYRILGLLSGTYVVSCSLSGYVTGKFPQESWRVPAFYLVLNAAQQASDIDFRLQKNASIAGVISGEDGKPLAGISVQAFSRYYTHGGTRLEPRGNGRTDSQGRYRIAALASGNYFVQAAKVVGPEGYSSAFYPGSPDMAGGKLVNLLIGRDLGGIDFRLKKSPAYRVAGKLLDLRTNAEVKEGYTVTVAPENGTAGVLATVGKDGVFQFASLIPGKYRLTATMTDLKSGTPFKVTKNIEVAQAPLTDLVVKIAAGGTVRVVVSAKEGEAPPRLALALVRREEAEDPGRPFAPLRFSMEDTKTYEFHNVAPGEYVLLLGSSTRPDTRRFFLEAVTEGTKDVQEDGVVVPEGLGNVELSAVVNTHGGMVNGMAMDSKRQPLLGRAIVLVSADRAKRTLRHYSMVSWTDGSGAFHFTGLIPGEYLAVLWTGGDPGEAQNPAYFDEVEHNAAPVHVPPDGEVTFGLRSTGTEK